MRIESIRLRRGGGGAAVHEHAHALEGGAEGVYAALDERRSAQPALAAGEARIEPVTHLVVGAAVVHVDLGQQQIGACRGWP